MRQQIEDRIAKLSTVGQQSFNGSDYTFGFETWRSGTITLLRQVLPKNTEVIDQIKSINLRRITVVRTDVLAYNLEPCKSQAKEILEILLSTLPANTANINDDSFWTLMHPKVLELAKPRFDNGFYGDAIVSCLREANANTKSFVKAKTGRELDGAALMNTTFSVNTPIVELADLSTESGRNIQQGYMQMFSGLMTGVRNPKSHENMNPDRIKTIHLLFHVSFLFIKLDEVGITGG